MQKLTTAGQRSIDEIAQRHGFSTDAVLSMLDSVVRGHGTMAQFSHPEFGGSGQWMHGGMTLVSDMFNNHLKDQVDRLCSDLSRLIADDPGIIRTEQARSVFVRDTGGTHANWWPAELGRPNSTGAQNDVRYAFFADVKRLAIEVHGKLTVYDTLDHQLGGFSQQQSRDASLTFTSQHGPVAIESLPVVSGSASKPSPSAASTQTSAHDADVFAMIEKLAQLHAKGILDDDEYAAKKADLLSRL